MKNVVCFVLNQDKEVFITNKEWQEYCLSIDNGKQYWCERIETLLPVTPKFVQTPQEDIGYEVYLEIRKDGTVGEKWFKKGDYWCKEINGGKFDFTELKKDKKLINQEEYYEKKMYL